MCVLCRQFFLSSFAKNFQVFFTVKDPLAVATVIVGVVTARSLFFSYAGVGATILRFGLAFDYVPFNWYERLKGDDFWLSKITKGCLQP